MTLNFMTPLKSPRTAEAAFTLIELVTTIVVVGVLAAALLPAWAKSGGRAGQVTCFSNKRQMAIACAMYSAEWSGFLVPNAPAGYASGWVNRSEDWGSSDANTNTTYYETTCLWPYLRDVRAYKCPNDRLPSDNGDRIRSISMNGAIAGALPLNYLTTLHTYLGSSWRLYVTTADLVAPGPASTWVFCDESMYSLNDGFLQVNLNSPNYPDVPACYDLSGNCFSFADAHVEYHKWLWLSTVPNTSLRNCPYVPHLTGGNWGSGGVDPDRTWLSDHTSAK